MNKLIEFICRLMEKLDSLISELRVYTGGGHAGAETTLFVISNASSDTVPFIGRNENRVEVWVHNASEFNLFLAPISDGDIHESRYSLAISPGDTLIINSHSFIHLYKKDIWGFWDGEASNTAKAMITEFYTT